MVVIHAEYVVKCEYCGFESSYRNEIDANRSDKAHKSICIVLVEAQKCLAFKTEEAFLMGVKFGRAISLKP